MYQKWHLVFFISRKCTYTSFKATVNFWWFNKRNWAHQSLWKEAFLVEPAESNGPKGGTKTNPKYFKRSKLPRLQTNIPAVSTRPKETIIRHKKQISAHTGENWRVYGWGHFSYRPIQTFDRNKGLGGENWVRGKPKNPSQSRTPLSLTSKQNFH